MKKNRGLKLDLLNNLDVSPISSHRVNSKSYLVKSKNGRLNNYETGKFLEKKKKIIDEFFKKQRES